MHELKRQAYLEAMGIQAYYPRVPLNNARPSPSHDVLAQLPVPSAPAAELRPPATAGNRISPKSAASNSGASISRELLRDTGSRVKPGDATAPPVAAKAQAKERLITESEAPVAELRFRLRYYRINDRLAVIEEIPHSQQQGQGSMELLRAILLALGVDYSNVEFSSDAFDWPLDMELPALAISSDYARQALTGFIKQRNQRDGFANLLVFAAQVDELLAADTPLATDSSQASPYDFQPRGCNYNLTLTHSLQAMLVHSSLKKEVWQQLQPLRQRLTC
jgi:hypothetical protein